MQRHPVTALFCLLLGLLLVATGPVLAAGKAHQHGALKLDVAIEGNKLTLAMEAPLDNLLGFERAPRTEAERKAAADVLARLRSPDIGSALFTADAAALCVLRKAEVNAPVLEPVTKPPARAAASDEHADLEASYEFNCAQPQQLRTLEVGLFDAYKRIQRIDVQVAGPAGQSKVTLKRPAKSIKLTR